MARAPLRPRRVTWDGRRDDALISMRSRGVPDERIAQSLCRPMSDIARRVDELRAIGFEIRRRTPSTRCTPRYPVKRRGPLDTAEREVLVALHAERLSVGAIAAHLGRARGPVATAFKELVNG